MSLLSDHEVLRDYDIFVTEMDGNCMFSAIAGCMYTSWGLVNGLGCQYPSAHHKVELRSLAAKTVVDTARSVVDERTAAGSGGAELFAYLYTALDSEGEVFSAQLEDMSCQLQGSPEGLINVVDGMVCSEPDKPLHWTFVYIISISVLPAQDFKPWAFHLKFMQVMLWRCNVLSSVVGSSWFACSNLSQHFSLVLGMYPQTYVCMQRSTPLHFISNDVVLHAAKHAYMPGVKDPSFCFFGQT